MNQGFYNFFIFLYSGALKLVSLFNAKAKLAYDGRKNWEEKMANFIDSEQDWIWMHCSSLGEFEQGRPVLEALKKEYPNYKIALSFFSPSGYEIRKNYDTDYVFYIPIDTKSNAKKLTQILKPKLWILVKYDYWYNLLQEQKNAGTPIVVISAIFRKNQVYFESKGKWFAKNLKQNIAHFYVQDKESKELLKSVDIEQVTVSGDTRFDRVKSLLKSNEKLNWVTNFKQNQKLLVAGSTWEEDEQHLTTFINQNQSLNWKYILVPHEIKPNKIKSLQDKISVKSILYSEIDNNTYLPEYQVIIVNAIGFLSKIYADADLAYVGGGFNKSGVHNTLEPAVFGTAVVIGPNYEKFQEVKLLKQKGVLFSIENQKQLDEIFLNLMQNDERRIEIKNKAQQVFDNQPNATKIIVDDLRQYLT